MSPNQSYIYLHKVDGAANNNKFYEMKANTDGSSFTVKYGREGAEKPQSQIKSMSLWESVYKEKTGSTKGYTDVTAFKAVTIVITPASVKNSKGQIISTDKEVIDLVTLLQSYANVATSASYKVEAKAVTQAQVDEAQKQINNLSTSFKKYFGKTEWNLDSFNKALSYLYIIIPRKMKKVADHLMTPTTSKKEIETLIEAEQDLLDSMASLVAANIAATDSDATDDLDGDNQVTLLEALGLTVIPATDSEFREAKSHSQSHGGRISRVFKVVNKASQTVFDADMKKTDAAGKKTMLLWHGSRRANWWFILQQGLKIRPSGAIHTGSMFGDGIYFASEDDKSMGYTDGGRWTGSSNSGKTYMALYEVRVGKQFETQSSDWNLSFNKIQSKGGFDSTWGKKGPSLFRNEYIIYRSQQSTIKYLVEFK